MKKNKQIYSEFNRRNYVVELNPQLLVAAEQEGGVIIATNTGFYKLEKIDWKDGAESKGVVADEVELQSEQDALAGEAQAQAEAEARGQYEAEMAAAQEAEYEAEMGGGEDQY